MVDKSKRYIDRLTGTTEKQKRQFFTSKTSVERYLLGMNRVRGSDKASLWLEINEFKRQVALYQGYRGTAFSPRMARLLQDAERKALKQEQEFKQRRKEESLAAAKTGRLLQRLWARGIGGAFIAAQVQTSTQFHRVLADQQYLINSGVKKQYRLVFEKETAQIMREIVYERTVREFGRTGFTLYVQPDGIVPPVLASRANIIQLSAAIRDQAQLAVYAALYEAAEDAMRAASASGGFPDAYADLFRERIIAVANDGKLKIVGGGAATEWMITVDFEELFGNQLDFQAAFHYHALLISERWKNRTMQEMENPVFDRSTIPWSGIINFKNTAQNRYKYWYAMWTGKRSYYGGYKNKRTATKGRSGMYKRKTDAEFAAIKKIQDRATSRTAGKGPYVSKESKLFEPTSEDKPKFGGIDFTPNEKQRIKNSEDEIDAFKSQRSKSIKGIKALEIPPGQKKETIKARTDYWRRKRVAPFWFLLEFGQLHYAPVIPPQGLVYRFNVIARRKINELMETALKNMLDARGVGINASGRPYHLGTTPSGRKGSYAPTSSLFTDLSNIDKRIARSLRQADISANRNMEQAQAEAGRFAGPSPAPPTATVVNPAALQRIRQAEANARARLDSQRINVVWASAQPSVASFGGNPPLRGGRFKSRKNSWMQGKGGRFIGSSGSNWRSTLG